MNQKRAKRLRKYAVELIERRQTADGSPLKKSYDMKISGMALKYYRQYSVNINHVHRIVRSIVRGNRIMNMVGQPKRVSTRTHF